MEGEWKVNPCESVFGRVRVDASGDRACLNRLDTEVVSILALGFGDVDFHTGPALQNDLEAAVIAARQLNDSVLRWVDPFKRIRLTELLYETQKFLEREFSNFRQ